MAQLRILRIERGEGDHLVNAVQTILDKKRVSKILSSKKNICEKTRKNLRRN